MPFSLLDSLDSDTDCLVEEKAYQVELQKRITSNVHIVERNSHVQGNVSGTNSKRENLIYDSLEVASTTIVDDQTRTDEEVTR